MPHEVIMPALGMAQDTGLLVAWQKQPGDPVAVGDILFEVETDKSTMEVEAQASGFLIGVTASAGDEVPVGNVIALIADSPDATGAAPEPTAEPAALPEGNSVIMPALGMAQDTGLIVAWHKAPGDAVAAGDILFEVETDKSTMEVEAGFDGFVAALLADAGEDAPVGETIAVISAEKPANPVQSSRKSGSVPAPAAPAPAPAPAPAKAAPAQTPAKTPAKPIVDTGGRVLASPKARRLAHQQGLDLRRLVEAGYPQPYHAADIEVLRSLPTAPAAHGAVAAPSLRLVADIPRDGFAEFATWAAQTAGLSDNGALLAGLVGASHGRAPLTVAVERFGETVLYCVPGGALGTVTRAEDDATADLRLRDLRASRIASVQLGSEDTPVLSLTRHAAGLSITLECAGHQMTASDAITLLSEFAGRMEQPLRHLL